MSIKSNGARAPIALSLYFCLCFSCPVHGESADSGAATKSETAGKNSQGKDLPPLDYGHIIEFTVTAVEPHEWAPEPGKSSKTRKVDLSLRLDGIIKSGLSLEAGQVANVVVIQMREPAGMLSEVSGFWSQRTLQKDGRYVLFSNGKGNDLGSAFGGAKELADLGEDTTVISDLRFIVKIGGLSPADQAAGICEYMAKSGMAHGPHLARYLAALAALPGMPSGAPLYGLISSPRQLKLSEKGLHTLIDVLQMKVAEDEEGNEKLTGPVTLAVCQILASIDPSEELSPIKSDALQNWLPWLARSEAARKHLQEFRKNNKEYPGVAASFEKLQGSRDINEENRRHLKTIAGILTSGK